MAKRTLTRDRATLGKADLSVREARFSNRRRAIQVALEARRARVAQGRLHRVDSLLGPREERAVAEEGMAYERGS
jgi:hypothetical protein